MSATAAAAALDRRFMAAALRLSRRHLGQTSTNPCVGALIVRDDGSGPVIVGGGVTAIGGRPHAETQALAEAGDLARGATAYVSLEPCSHQGRTPPCADALIAAGVARVVGGADDPDRRVAGRGYARLRAAGIEVCERVLASEAADQMAGYLSRSVKGRPEVTLKLALSSDGMIGSLGQGQIAITSATARRQVHLMRAEADAVLVGVGTAAGDDPELTVRLPGLQQRSPLRVVLDPNLRLPIGSKLARGARTRPLLIVSRDDADRQRLEALAGAGAEILVLAPRNGFVALPDLLAELARRGVSTLLVEGGAVTAAAFLEQGLVDRIALFRGPASIGTQGVHAPVDESRIPAGFRPVREARFGQDSYREWVREA